MSLDNRLDAQVFDANDRNIATVSEVVIEPDGSSRFVAVDFGGLTVVRDNGGDIRDCVAAAPAELEDAPRYRQK
jgi:hypothetical protein